MPNEILALIIMLIIKLYGKFEILDKFKYFN